MKHTPGPGRVGYADGSGGSDPDDFNEYFVITSVDTDVEVVSGASGEANMRDWCIGIESEADARLMAAAPALLEALEAMVAQECDYMKINNLGDPEEQHNIILSRAVIAKAKGE